MNCASCGRENREGVRFCVGCGESLAIACPGCGVEAEVGDRFCGSCGSILVEPAGGDPETPAPRDYTPRHLAEKILQSKSALEGERKQVTVLFADIQDSMALAERLDAEEWRHILGQFFDVLSEGVHRFEGTINQYLGDGVMALFGAPIAHEDHAQRACWAALRVRDEAREFFDRLRVEKGLNFGLRIGLNSGDVVVGKIGDDLRMDYTAQGHTVGLAQRMEQLADSGRVTVSAHTARLVEGYFDLRDLGEAQIKGVQEPLGIHELVGVGSMRTRLDRSRARGFSRFVGRGREMDAVNAALENALSGSGQVVGVVGEAGVGKSRLCAEFVEAVRARGIPVNEAHCPAHGRTVPYLPLLEMFRSFFGIGERDSDHEARRKIAGELALLGGEFEEVLPLVFDLLGVPDPERPAPDLSADARKKQLFAFQRRLIQARSEREPAVLMVDDVHWIDPGSDEFLAQSVEAVSGTRTLLLLNFRPEYSAEWTSRSWYQQLPLVPLGPEAIRELLDDLLGHDASLAELSARVAERTRGNPFFTEEVVASLVESGHLAGERGAYRLVRAVDEIEIPASVHPVLSARIDRLPERDKHVLQTAAVIGKRFPQAILERVVELPDEDLAAALAALEAAEFIYPEVLYPEPEYEFKHPLTQEVSLDSQLAERRRTISESVAQALIDVYPEKHDELAALIAQHFEHAGLALEAARWHGRAARWAESSDPKHAAVHWQKVRELAPPEAARELAVEARIELLKGSFRLGSSRDDADQLYREGLELAGDDVARRVILIAWYGRTINGLGYLREYLGTAREAMALSERTDDPEALSDAWTVLVDSLTFAGEWDQELAASEEAMSRFDRPDAPKVAGFVAQGIWRHFRALGSLFQGRLNEAREDLERGLRIALDQDSPDTGYLLSIGLVWLADTSGDTAAGLHAARRAAEFIEAAGDPPGYQIWVHSKLALAQVLAGSWDDAAATARTALRIRDEQRVELNSTEARAYLAAALLGAGDYASARDEATTAVERSREHGRQFVEIRALPTLALSRAHLEGPDADGVEALLDEADAIIGRTHAHAFTPRVVEARAELQRLRGDRDRERALLGDAHRLYTDMGASGHADRVAGLLRELEPS